MKEIELNSCPQNGSNYSKKILQVKAADLFQCDRTPSG